MPDRLIAIAEKFALELRAFGHCRGPVHRPMFEGKPDERPCDCRHCEVLRQWEAWKAIVLTPEVAAEQARRAGEEKP
jgi:hypothetical protein